jgi:HAE1 family hydrophobic/amphiphilic exporter-1
MSAAIGGLIVVASLVLLGSRPVGFQPIGDPGYLYLNVEGPPGATRAQMDTAISQATRVIERNPDVGQVFAQVGSSSGGGFQSASGGDLREGAITVVLKANRAHKTDQVKTALRPLLRQIPDVRITTLGGFGSADVEIVLSSQNGAALERVQLELEREMRTLPVISDVRPAPPPSGPELVIRPKTAEAARLGVTSDALASVLRIATIGDIDANVAKFSQGERRIPIRVRLPESARADLTTLGNLQIPTLNGKSTPLSSVADLSFQTGPAQIVRYSRERRASVQADLRGVSLGTGAIASGIALIFAVLILLFRSFFKPVIIMGALPLSLCGAGVALWLAGLEIDMPVFIGLLMLFGITAKNSILLVEFAIEEERAGAPRIDALRAACRERARPIVMTTVAMIAGMLPTALGLGQGSEFRKPMAVAVIGGLTSSTLLSLVLVPVIYLFVGSLEQAIQPLLGRLITHKQPGDDAPIREDEEALVPDGVWGHECRLHQGRGQRVRRSRPAGPSHLSAPEPGDAAGFGRDRSRSGASPRGLYGGPVGRRGERRPHRHGAGDARSAILQRAPRHRSAGRSANGADDSRLRRRRRYRTRGRPRPELSHCRRGRGRPKGRQHFLRLAARPGSARQEGGRHRKGRRRRRRDHRYPIAVHR